MLRVRSLYRNVPSPVPSLRGLFHALDGSGHDSKKASKLPAPVTARRTNSQSKLQYLQYIPTPKRHVSEKRLYTHRPSQSWQPQPQMAYIPEMDQNGECTALAPLTTTDLTIMLETHRPGGEKTELQELVVH
jgi:hypothetical protein